ncbi:hypothetical protein GCM10010912_30180 [Paenibacillus albidus]|uniref:Uncharacterized protein n=1 Tax=Paenibacillus albidus TaxID=2041023 RepID=A0A917CCG2_9BACL|nr:hypothetical protein [Paenibacillus albidus]GGF83028.1 hypothetical protein GCM10010912_30180 [Paenibacillus albidus]
MTAEEIREFGEALAERFVQIEKEYLSATETLKKVQMIEIPVPIELMQATKKLDFSFAQYELFSGIIDTLPLDIRLTFLKHCQKIRGNKEGI